MLYDNRFVLWTHSKLYWNDDNCIKRILICLQHIDVWTLTRDRPGVTQTTARRITTVSDTEYACATPMATFRGGVFYRHPFFSSERYFWTRITVRIQQSFYKTTVQIKTKSIPTDTCGRIIAHSMRGFQFIINRTSESHRQPSRAFDISIPKRRTRCRAQITLKGEIWSKASCKSVLWCCI